jgi:hypothetical protein
VQVLEHRLQRKQLLRLVVDQEDVDFAVHEEFKVQSSEF